MSTHRTEPELVDHGTSFYTLADHGFVCIDLSACRSTPADLPISVTVTCQYCGNRYTNPAVLRCVDGCGATFPEPPALMRTFADV